MENIKQLIDEREQKILEKNPNWSQEKARWLAMQCLGMIDARRR